MHSQSSTDGFGLYQPYLAWLAAGEHEQASGDTKAFIDQLRRAKLELDDFDWKAWYDRTHLVDKPDYLAQASLLDCRVIISAMLRLERFSPGVVENLRRQGVLCALMARLDTLLQPEASHIKGAA